MDRSQFRTQIVQLSVYFGKLDKLGKIGRAAKKNSGKPQFMIISKTLREARFCKDKYNDNTKSVTSWETIPMVNTK